MEIICYSCGRGENPENSLQGIRHCQYIDSNWRIEMDIQITADNKLVLFHDYETIRTTGKVSRIDKLTLSETAELNIGYNFSIEGNFPYRNNPIRLPELVEVFREFPNAKLILDIHSNSQNISQVFIDLIEKEFKLGDFIVVSEYDEVIKQIKSKKPNWTFGVPAKEAKRLLYSSYLYLDDLFPIKSDVLMLPQKYGNINVLSNRILNHAKKRNKELWAWIYESKDLDTKKFKAVESIEEFEELKKLGVSGVFTEYPQRLFNELDKFTD
jgi:glycerophosphoryl diester phosphodiesterase